MYYVIIALTILSIVHGTSNTTSTSYEGVHHVHLLDQQGRPYPYGSAEISSKYVNEALARLATTTLQHGSCAVVFHGTMGTGKSSLIERLTSKRPGSLSSGSNDKRGGHTQQPDCFQLNFNVPNSCHVIDTVGFGETSLTGQVNVDSGLAKVAEKIVELQVPLYRLYLVLDPDHTQITSELTILKQAFGADVARRTRLIVNKSDLLADKGQNYIHQILVPKLQSAFRKEFGANPDQILFVSARYHSRVACIGQLIDDLCHYRDGDLINMDGSRVQLLQAKVKEDQALIKALDESPSIRNDEYQQTSAKLISLKYEFDNRKNLAKAKLQTSRHELVRKQDLLKIKLALDKFPDTDTTKLCEQFQNDVHNVNVGIFFVTHQLLQLDDDAFRQKLQSELDPSWTMESSNLIEFWNRLHAELAKESPLNANVIQDLEGNIAQQELVLQELEQQISQNEHELRVLKHRRHR